MRNAHAMAYDGVNSRVLLFGGADEKKVSGETWTWTGKNWRLVSTKGPAPRTFASMAYDSFRKRVVLFGGNRVLFGKTPSDNHFLDDTWEWDGTRWTLMNVPGPPARAEAAMTYDSKRGRMVLFGGYTRSDQERQFLGDTWEWDGVSWAKASDQGPSPRNGSAMAFDVARARVVLFGGSSRGIVSGETWEWDGQHWLENRGAVTEGRFNSTMTYDVIRRRVVRFGGRNGGKPLGDTWEYDGKRWTRSTSIGPSARNHTAMVYDQAARATILFGGHDFGLHETASVLGDTWALRGNRWRLLAPGQTKPRIDNGH